MSAIEGHYCGQTQPHAAHTWTTPQVYGTATLISTYQCAGFLAAVPRPTAQSGKPTCSDPDCPIYARHRAKGQTFPPHGPHDFRAADEGTQTGAAS